MSGCWFFGVECDTEVCGGLAVDNFEHGVHKSVNGGCVDAFTVHDGVSDESEVCSIDEGHSIK